MLTNSSPHAEHSDCHRYHQQDMRVEGRKWHPAPEQYARKGSTIVQVPKLNTCDNVYAFSILPTFSQYCKPVKHQETHMPIQSSLKTGMPLTYAWKHIDSACVSSTVETARLTNSATRTHNNRPCVVRMSTFSKPSSCINIRPRQD